MITRDMVTNSKKVSHIVRNIIIAGVVIVILVVAGVLIQSFSANTVHVTGSYLTIYYVGPTSSGYFGQKFRPFGSSFSMSTDTRFTQSVTIDNNASSPGGGTGNLTISSITVDPGLFQIGSISPALPVVLGPGSGVTFKIPVQSTDVYSGPLNYTLTLTY